MGQSGRMNVGCASYLEPSVPGDACVSLFVRVCISMRAEEVEAVCSTADSTAVGAANIG